MLYASELYRHLGTGRVAIEENPEDIADLVAQILCHQVKERMERRLSYGYESKVAVINRVRGQIDAHTTERRRLLEKGRVCCRFDEFVMDTPRNRYVRAALERLPRLGIKKDLAQRCRSLAASFERLGVSRVKPMNYSGRTARLGRHDVGDEKMLAAAELVLPLALPTESDGTFHLPKPDIEESRLRKLFEKAVAGFYRVVLDQRDWKVAAGKQLHWQKSERSSGMDKILPRMETDIMVDQRSTGKRFVIDTKFNPMTIKGQHDNETLRSGYIYQIYAYLRSQVGQGDSFADHATGVLLHPAIDTMRDEWALIQGHKIQCVTVNLMGTAQEIRKQLLQVVGAHP